jgi:hypothetical protein
LPWKRRVDSILSKFLVSPLPTRESCFREFPGLPPQHQPTQSQGDLHLTCPTPALSRFVACLTAVFSLGLSFVCIHPFIHPSIHPSSILDRTCFFFCSALPFPSLLLILLPSPYRSETLFVLSFVILGSLLCITSISRNSRILWCSLCNLLSLW